MEGEREELVGLVVGFQMLRQFSRFIADRWFAHRIGFARKDGETPAAGPALGAIVFSEIRSHSVGVRKGEI